MRWIRRAARVTDGDLVQAWLYGCLTPAVDLWLLSFVPEGRGHDQRVVAAFLAFLASAGALAGFGLGVLRGRRRPDVTPGSRRPVLRLVRCATTGALYAHLVLPAALVVDLALSPDRAIAYLVLLGA
ncbi:hypothetical protein AB0C76_33715 [Kitasatospora sp. NPDC048722]|uniref:hypothetical protein n=1 Tax=Kitasatospora sp. NPDC048722 TaxID=3155639 RepID=UPI0033E6E344